MLSTTIAALAERQLAILMADVEKNGWQSLKQIKKAKHLKLIIGA